MTCLKSRGIKQVLVDQPGLVLLSVSWWCAGGAKRSFFSRVCFGNALQARLNLAALIMQMFACCSNRALLGAGGGNRLTLFVQRVPLRAFKVMVSKNRELCNVLIVLSMCAHTRQPNTTVVYIVRWFLYVLTVSMTMRPFQS